MKHMPAIQIGDHDEELPSYETMHPIIEQDRERLFRPLGGDNVVRLADEDQIRTNACHPTEDAFEVPGFGMYADRNADAKTPTLSDGAIYAAVSADAKTSTLTAPVRPEAAKGGLDIYIAGPMTGIPNFNFPAFYAAQEYLERQGHRVFNPAERDKMRHGGIDISFSNDAGDPAQAVRDYGFSLRDALRDDTHYICTTATAIAMLPGWKKSKGACAEHELAHALDLIIIYLGGFYA